MSTTIKQTSLPSSFSHLFPIFPVGADQQFDSSLLCCNSLVVDKTISSKLPGTGICADTATSCFVVDLVGKRCIQLPNATATTATCASFGKQSRGSRTS